MASWYKNTREGFLADNLSAIIDSLHKTAAADGWYIEPEQDEEWRASVFALQAALRDETMKFITGVLAEYDFRRRGIRIDFVLLAPGVLFVVEFKRKDVAAADRDQVMNYCVNLVEFHECTQRLQPKLIPLLVSRTSHKPTKTPTVEWQPNWPQICRHVAYAREVDVGRVMRDIYQRAAPSSNPLDYIEWDAAPFHPSSSIIDAAISLYGQHEVSAMKDHAAPKEAIDKCVATVISEIKSATMAGRNELIIVSGDPGAGKTLVGMAVTFHQDLRGDAVFVTGNAPLVKVLNGSLQRFLWGN